MSFINMENTAKALNNIAAPCEVLLAENAEYIEVICKHKHMIRKTYLNKNKYVGEPKEAIFWDLSQVVNTMRLQLLNSHEV